MNRRWDEVDRGGEGWRGVGNLEGVGGIEGGGMTCKMWKTLGIRGEKGSGKTGKELGRDVKSWCEMSRVGDRFQERGCGEMS
jgi:hypothetical protein